MSSRLLYTVLCCFGDLALSTTCECGEHDPYCASNGYCYRSDTSYLWCGAPGCCNKFGNPACTSNYVPPTCTCGPHFPYCEDGQCRSHSRAARWILLDREDAVCYIAQQCGSGDPVCGSDDHGDYGSSDGDRCSETGSRRLSGEMPWKASGLTCTASYAVVPPAPPTDNCHDETTCSAVEACHMEFPKPCVTARNSETVAAAICDFPDIPTGCCDHYKAVLFCNLNPGHSDCSALSGSGHGAQHCPDFFPPEASVHPFRMRMIQHCKDEDGNSFDVPPSGTCHDEASCLGVASESCHVQFGPDSCDFPNLCAGLCDWLHLQAYCQDSFIPADQCQQRMGHSLSPGEQQWRQSLAMVAPVDWCPGAGALIAPQNLSSHCRRSPGTASAFQWEEVAIMTAQTPQPELRGNQTPFLAVGTLAIVAALMTSVIAVTKRRNRPDQMYTRLDEGAA